MDHAAENAVSGRAAVGALDLDLARATRTGWLLRALSCGIIVNIHPISGACIAAALLVSELAWGLGERRQIADITRRCATGAVMILVGASPFLISFWLTLGQLGGVDPAEFERATRERLSPVFGDIALYLSSWLQMKWMLLIMTPWVICVSVWSRLSQRSGPLRWHSARSR